MKVRHLGRVVLWMSGALLSFSAMALGIRNLSGAFTTFEILALRTGSGLFVMLVIGALQPHLFRSFTTHRIWLHATRNSIHLVSQYLWTASIALLPQQPYSPSNSPPRPGRLCWPWRCWANGSLQAASARSRSASPACW